MRAFYTRRRLFSAALLGLAAAAVTAAAVAAPWWMRGVESNEANFLPPDAAFRVSARVDGGTLRIRWVIADGYYLYRRRMAVAAESPDLVLGTAFFPRGAVKSDQYLGTQEIYTQQVEATVAFTRLDAGAHPLQVKVTYQGCADAGLCYPPLSKVLRLDNAPPGAATRPHPWEGVAILGGGFAFLLAGFLLRGERRLDTPAS